MLAEIRPILEGRLYEWGKYAGDTPTASISTLSPFDNRTDYRHSPQEDWVVRWDYIFKKAKDVERILGNLSGTQRKLVTMRYRDRQTWEAIAEAMNVSQRQAFRIRDEVLSIFAYEFGMLRARSKSLQGEIARA